jgi:hypothetical protein
MSLYIVPDISAGFEHNCEIRTITTRNRANLHLPDFRLATVQKDAYYSGIKVYNDLLSHVKSLIYDKRKFKTTLKKLSSDTFLLFFRRIFQY